jgi:MFS transporter, PAT family, beta-lactamase induction signal transducer AmpG
VTEPAPRRLSTWESLAAVAQSWRLASVALLQFPSGLPLGLVWLAVPTWLTEQGVDIKMVGLVTLAQAPWTFKFLWAPLLDRFPLPFLGRKRGWIVVCQVGLLVTGLALALYSDRPDAVVIVALLALAHAFASATQDIAIDAHAVEVLRQEEQGAAVGARLAVYRTAMWISGRLSVTAAAWAGWPVVNVVLALLYVPSLLITRWAPEPESPPPPPQSLRDAVWGPFVGMLGQHRALEILAFVLLYKLSDNLTQALTGPFLVKMEFSALDRGVAVGTIGLFAIIVGTILGGLLTNMVGLGRALWIGGFLQIFSNLGYAVVAHFGPDPLVNGPGGVEYVTTGLDRALMYGATGVEYLTTGLGNGAFGVLLLRLTQKRFSATQYALLSSLFTLPRVIAGPPAALLADAIGWRDFFVFTLATGVPGLVMLYRFVPWGTREPHFRVAEPSTGPPLSRAGLVMRSVFAGLAAFALSVGAALGLDAIRAHRAGRSFDWLSGAGGIAWPHSAGDLTTLVAVLVMGLGVGLATAAGLAARRQASAIQSSGIAPPPVP